MGSNRVPVCLICNIEMSERRMYFTVDECKHKFHLTCSDMYFKLYRECPRCNRQNYTMRKIDAMVRFLERRDEMRIW